MLNRKIAKCLISAQIASDAGKGIYELDNSVNATESYHGKDIYILTAIKTCIKKRNTGFNFYVTKDDEIALYLVYFSFQVNDEKYQISFHSFDHRLEKYLSPKSHEEIWDEKSSRDTAKLLQYLIS